MNYRRVGRYGLRVSEIALGGWLTQGQTIDDGATEAIVRRAFDLGVNLFDTADSYGAGAAEIALGRAIRPLPRHDLVLATKCFFPMSDGPNGRGLSRKHVTESVHSSLRRLGTDYIDLMQLHRFDPETPLDETIRAIDDLVRAGKVLYWGVSEWKAHQITEACAVAKDLNAHPPISNQPRYNMLQPEIEDEVLPVSMANGLGQIAFSPLAQGVLTGKYLPGRTPPEGSRGADESSNGFMKGFLKESVLERVEDLNSFSRRQRLELGTLALAWCLRMSGVASVIVGATRAEQLDANVRASGVELPDQIWSQAMSIVRPHEDVRSAPSR